MTIQWTQKLWLTKHETKRQKQIVAKKDEDEAKVDPVCNATRLQVRLDASHDVEYKLPWKV